MTRAWSDVSLSRQTCWALISNITYFLQYASV